MIQTEVGFLLGLLAVCFSWAVAVEIRLNMLKSSIKGKSDEQIKKAVDIMSDPSLDDALKDILGPK